jgi:4-carboxymuconolactone decarboxylase
MSDLRRPSTPRVAPIPPDERGAELREILAGPMAAAGSNGGNWFTTGFRNEGVFKAWRPLARHLNANSTLPWRHRELAILRTAWLTRSEYEWGQHVLVGRNAGLTDEEIDRVRHPERLSEWDPFEAAVLRAPDQLQASSCLDDETWATLRERYDDAQMIEFLLLVGQYFMLAFTLNSLGVQREDGVPGWETPSSLARDADPPATGSP